MAAVKRPGRGAVGAYGQEVKGPKFGDSLKKSREGQIDDEESSTDDEQTKPSGQWRKDGSKKRPKYRFASCFLRSTVFCKATFYCFFVLTVVEIAPAGLCFKIYICRK